MNYPSTHQSLLERVQNGDEFSWAEFYDRYKPVIRAVGSLYHFSEDERDDLVQRVMVKFFANSKTYVYREGVVKFRTHLARIIRSEAVDYIRSNAAQRKAEARVDSLNDYDYAMAFVASLYNKVHYENTGIQEKQNAVVLLKITQEQCDPEYGALDFCFIFIVADTPMGRGILNWQMTVDINGREEISTNYKNLLFFLSCIEHNHNGLIGYYNTFHPKRSKQNSKIPPGKK